MMPRHPASLLGERRYSLGSFRRRQRAARLVNTPLIFSTQNSICAFTASRPCAARFRCNVAPIKSVLKAVWWPVLRSFALSRKVHYA